MRLCKHCGIEVLPWKDGATLKWLHSSVADNHLAERVHWCIISHTTEPIPEGVYVPYDERQYYDESAE